MTAKEKMEQRADLVEQLTAIDLTIQDLGREPSYRASADARSLLDERADVCDQLRLVGFEPWAVA